MPPSSVFHILLLHASREADEFKLEEITSSILALKDKSIKDGRPYIRSLVGGRDMSNENAQHGITHTFIFEFESVEDRDFYVEEDKAHHAVRALVLSNVGKVVMKAQVTDFVGEEF